MRFNASLAAIWHCWFTICLWSSVVPRPFPAALASHSNFVFVCIDSSYWRILGTCLYWISLCWFWPCSAICQVCFEFLTPLLDILAPFPRTVSFTKSVACHQVSSKILNNARPRTILHLKYPSSLTLNYLTYFNCFLAAFAYTFWWLLLDHISLVCLWECPVGQ